MSILTTVAIAVGVLVLAFGWSLPEAWWPRTGRAFTPHTVERADSCHREAGPAKVSCERGRSESAARSQDSDDASVWKLVPAVTALGAFVVWQRRTARQGRR
ncbi:hypothetical protein [Streptomyces sp. MN13]